METMYDDSTPPQTNRSPLVVTVPRSPLGNQGGGTDTCYKYIILGAGCAGLSLCWYLLEEGIRDPILILDRKAAFGDDRTWCFWDTEPTPFTHLVTHRWDAWSVRRDATTPEIRASAPATPYVRLQGGDFYREVLGRIQAHPNVTLRLGVPITDGYRDHGAAGVRVVTGAGTFHGEMLFDALALGSPRFPAARPGDVTFLQRFFGQTVRADADVFDPDTVTLMDFGVTPRPDGGHAAPDAVRFMYILPFSPREALVENTVLMPGAGGAKDRLAHAADADADRLNIAAYLRSRYNLSSFEVVSEERGLIPMTTRDFPTRGGSRSFPIGLAGGAARPSSGYAFLRIQKQCRNLARAVVRGGAGTVTSQPSSLRTALLDRVFLQAMQRNPNAVPDYFARMFGRVPPEKLVRLLSDTASPLDCLAVIGSLPLADFVRAAVSCVPRPWSGG